MMLHLTDHSEEPLHHQLARQLSQKVARGDWEAGQLLPRAGSIARRERISVRSVERALRRLECDGVLTRTGDRFAVGGGGDDAARPAALDPTSVHDLLDRFDPDELRTMVADLDKARQIQKNLLPKALPADESVSVSAHSRPSRTVGGDFHDYVPLDGGRFGIVIADASGKGLPAAMLISQIQAAIRSEINHGNSIDTALRNVNEYVLASTASDAFATLFIGIFDRATSTLEYANAGHDFPVLVRGTGGYEQLSTGGMLLGIAPGQTYPVGAATLSPGDFVCFFTDGVTETTNGAGEEYGERRFICMLQEVRHLDAQGVIDAVLSDLRRFEAEDGDCPPQDDRTLVVLRANHMLAGEARENA